MAVRFEEVAELLWPLAAEYRSLRGREGAMLRRMEIASTARRLTLLRGTGGFTEGFGFKAWCRDVGITHTYATTLAGLWDAPDREGALAAHRAALAGKARRLRTSARRTRGPTVLPGGRPAGA